MAQPSREEILRALAAIPYPGFTRDIVSAGAVGDVTVESGRVIVTLNLPEGRRDLAEQLTPAVRKAVSALPGVTQTVVRAGPRARLPVAGEGVQDAGPALPRARHVIGIASGKGGVGKSTVAVNLAVELARRGRAVGFLDADVHGPSAPLMFGLAGQRPRTADERGRPRPLEAYGVRVMSMGFFVDRGSAVIWRGPIVGNFIRQLLTDVDWGELDDLVIDFPPGTGDAQLTISQTLRMTGALVVTTPNELALIDALKAIAMFRKVQVPLLGLVENMAYFACPKCGERAEIFGSGGAERASRDESVPLLGRLPVDPDLARDGDTGRPVVAARPDSAPAAAFREIADAVLAAVESRDERPEGLSAFLKRFGGRHG
ncbi:MAG: iron-sulfur cluster carrier protein ApbC [Acidobacteria bacterium]|nr:MAG: iron-sulfur cluster carrier protein ApbC [Acidobacteriota bacterium]